MSDQEMTESIEDVAGVLHELKEQVRQQHNHILQAGPMLEGGALLEGRTPPGRRPASLEMVHATRQVNPHLPIAWPTWPRGVWPKIVAAVQKVVRRALCWYINPIVDQQNRHNAAVAQTLDLLWGEVARLRAQLAAEESRREVDEQ